MKTETSNRLSGEGRKKIRNDIILVAVILVIALAVTLIFLFGGKPGSVVNVLIDGRPAGQFDLSEDDRIPITAGPNGEYSNVLVIEDSKAFVSEANCPDKICVSHRKISKSGETIVCLPHRIVIEIE